MSLLITGPSNDGTVQWVLSAARALDVPHHFLDMLRFHKTPIIRGSTASPTDLELGDGVTKFNLGSVSLAFLRLVCLAHPQMASPARQKIIDEYSMLRAALASAPFRKVNPPFAGHSNGNKPWHTMEMSHLGFTVPISISTKDAQRGKDFTDRFAGRTICKSNGYHRTVVAFTHNDFESLQNCPAFIQQYIPGVDVRVHVILGRVFPVRIESVEPDYRYDRTGKSRWVRCSVPEYIARAAIEGARKLGLEIAGFDFRTEETTGAWVALEANPMPAFHIYDKVWNGEMVQHLLAGVMA